MDNGEPQPVDDSSTETPEGRAQQPIGMTAPSMIQGDKQKESTTKAIRPEKEKSQTETEILDRVKKGERWMILLTAVVAATAVCQAVQSCNSNKSTAQQIDKLIAAASQIQQAAAQFSRSAEGINGGISDAVGKLDIQAGNAQQSNALQLLVGHAAYGPLIPPFNWMGVYRDGDRLHALVRLYNDGRSVAFNVRVAGRMTIRDTAPSEKDYRFSAEEFVPADPPSLVPQVSPANDWHSDHRIQMRDSIAPNQYGIYGPKTIYTWGVIRYQDFSRTVATLRFCRATRAASVFASQPGEGSGYVSTPSEDCAIPYH